MVSVNEDFARRIIALHGEAGRVWLEGLPALLEHCEGRWGLKVGPPFAPLSYNYAAPAEGPRGERLVLKLGVPTHGLLGEINALLGFDGSGAARLFDSDAARGALLLERLEPGTPLTALCEKDDAAATSAAASVMRKLNRAGRLSPQIRPTAADWGQGFERCREHFGGTTGPFPPKLFGEAESLYAELLSTSAPPALLHGDLHHGNILAAGRAPWLAIDPQGVVAEPAYEVGALLRNPLPQLLRLPDPVRTTERRIAQLSDELGFERARVRGWGLAQAVLSAWWSIEDEGELGEHGYAAAEILAATRFA
ncbi:MAG TPA: aminoglycoside phosphotransferase family protein [Pyrinomonadaceae bacterium]|nr:aminoglycoside phosphotransferase family protein [Pyrinomonadaceae bacterium]